MNPLEVVVAHHSSLDFELIRPLLPEAKFVVYDKSGKYDGDCVRLPNKGREGHTYLTHIIDRYDSLADRTVFMQDDVLAHRPNLLSFVAEVISDKSDFHQFPCSWNGCDGFFHRMVVDGVCELELESGDDLIKRACSDLQIDLPAEYRTETCSFFSAKRDRLRTKGVRFYERIREWLLESEDNGYALEHMWKIVI